MGVSITLLGVVLIVALLWLLRRMRSRQSAETAASPERTPAAAVDVGSTIRSYVLPKRWLRGAPGSRRETHDTRSTPRYGSATVERTSETGSPATTWQLLRGRTRLGRDSDNHVVLDDERVSLHHALITVRDGVYWIEDLGSTNGTFVGDDQRVMAAHPLVDGEKVRLGGVVLVFRGVAA
jgi:hypothetical protein